MSCSAQQVLARGSQHSVQDCVQPINWRRPACIKVLYQACQGKEYANLVTVYAEQIKAITNNERSYHTKIYLYHAFAPHDVPSVRTASQQSHARSQQGKPRTSMVQAGQTLETSVQLPDKRKYSNLLKPNTSRSQAQASTTHAGESNLRITTCQPEPLSNPSPNNRLVKQLQDLGQA